MAACWASTGDGNCDDVGELLLEDGVADRGNG